VTSSSTVKLYTKPKSKAALRLQQSLSLSVVSGLEHLRIIYQSKKVVTATQQFNTLEFALAAEPDE
jgi:hypothetical protein